MPKRHLSIILAALIGTALCAIAQQPAPSAPSAVNPNAQAAPPAGAPPPPADPFVRDPRSAKAPGAAPADQAVSPVNLLITVETWSISQGDFLAIMELPSAQDAPYARFEELAKAGKAKLVGLIAVSTKSGLRAVTQSVDEVRYPVEFHPPRRAAEIAFPLVWESRNVGDTLEVEPVIGPDGRTIDLNLAPQSLRFGGYEELPLEAGAVPTAQPRFHSEKVTTSLTLQSGKPVILTTATPALDLGLPPAASEMRILVVRVAVQATPPSVTAPVSLADARLELLVYTLDREAARRILKENSDSARSHRAVQELVSSGQANVEIARMMTTKSGQRAVSEETTEVIYPASTQPPGHYPDATPAGPRSPASVGSFGTRSVGMTLECEPVIGPDGRVVDVNLVPQLVSYAGALRVTGVAAKYPAQPLFTTRKLTTSVTAAGGVPTLLGTMSQPRDNGVNDRKDDGKTSLAYIRVTPVAP